MSVATAVQWRDHDRARVYLDTDLCSIVHDQHAIAARRCEPLRLGPSQAANAAAAVAGTLLHPEAVQSLLAGQHRADGAAVAAGAASLGNTQGVGTMQELLLSLRAASAAGGGDVQRMFGAPCSHSLVACPGRVVSHRPALEITSMGMFLVRPDPAPVLAGWHVSTRRVTWVFANAGCWALRRCASQSAVSTIDPIPSRPSRSAHRDRFLRRAAVRRLAGVHQAAPGGGAESAAPADAQRHAALPVRRGFPV